MTHQGLSQGLPWLPRSCPGVSFANTVAYGALRYKASITILRLEYIRLSVNSQGTHFPPELQPVYTVLGHALWSAIRKCCPHRAAARPPTPQQPTYRGGCGTRRARTRPRPHLWLSAEGEEAVELFLTPRQGGDLSLQSPIPDPKHVCTPLLLSTRTPDHLWSMSPHPGPSIPIPFS